MFDVESYAFRGPAIYDGTKYRKLDIEDSEDRPSIDVRNGWVAALQHHFVTALVPAPDVLSHYSLQAEGHPAWKTVDPTDLPAGWQVSDCVLQGLDAAYPFVCRRPDGSEVSEGAAGGEGASALFISRVCARIGC